MDTKLKILLAAILLAAVFNREKIYKQFWVDKVKPERNSIALKSEVEETEATNYYVNDTLYHWDMKFFDWIPASVTLEEYELQLDIQNMVAQEAQEPIEVTWEFLTSILYRLRYFSAVEMEILAPVFPKSIKALDGKEVIIEGFVIPFEEDEEFLSLSANPFAACFFCGKASPASVISMYLKNKGKRYKMDDFKKFRGTLHLNYDDPEEFYYILREARGE